MKATKCIKKVSCLDYAFLSAILGLAEPEILEEKVKDIGLCNHVLEGRLEEKRMWALW